MGQPPPKTRTFSIYLLKPSIGSEVEAIENPAALVERPVRSERIRGTLFIKPTKVQPPAWVSFFSGAVDLDRIALKTASTSAALVFKVDNRHVAVVFGYGRHLLKPGCWDESFGLRTTLNSIDPDSIRSIDRKSFDTLSRHTREEANREGPIEQFGLNVEQDLLRAVVGRPSADVLGKRLAGMDALTATVALRLEDLYDQIGRYLGQWRKTTYRARFPWIDQIAEIRDSRTRLELDDLLCARLRTGNVSKSWLAVPLPVDWSGVGGFRYSSSSRAEIRPDLDLSEFLASLRNPTELAPEQLRRRCVEMLDADGQYPRDRWQVYQCLYAEVRQGSDVFLLTGGRWYRVAPVFVQKVDREVAAIRPTNVALPKFSHAGEQEFNVDAQRSDPSNIALMDRKNIPYGGGPSQIEFCDLYTKSCVMLHVKRYQGSSVLSHLFAQGVVAGTLFAQDADFRKALNKRLPLSHRLRRPEQRPRTEKYEVAFAIISKSRNALQLPFFSKVNLRQAYNTLSGLGYRVTLTKIDHAI